MMKRWLLLLLGGLLMITTLTGCSNRKSEAEIQEEFLDYLSMIPFNDLTVLYDKKGNILDVDLGPGDLGVWGLSTSLSYENDNQEKSEHTVLWFNRNTREARGFYYYEVNDVEEKYPIYYDETGIHLENEADVEKIGEELAKTIFLFQYLDLDKEYLDSLEVKRAFYNPEVPMQGICYHLDEDDKNVKKTLELYPQLKERMTESVLMLDSFSKPWNLRARVEAMLHLGESNSISSSLFFTNQQKYTKAVGE